MRSIALLAALFALGSSVSLSAAEAADVRETSFTDASKQRYLQHTAVLNAGRDEVWKIFTTSEGLSRFAAPVIEIELKPGGAWRSTPVPGGKIDKTSISNRIMAFVPGSMLAMQIGFPHSMPELIRNSASVHAVLVFESLDDGRTRVTETMYGFGEGPEWERIYQFFRVTNADTYVALAETLATGKPIDWTGPNPYNRRSAKAGRQAG